MIGIDDRLVLMILISRLPLLLAKAKQASSVTAADQSLGSVMGSNSSSFELFGWFSSVILQKSAIAEV